jgi:protein-S-isoprenylcysteine O-methyltransferase Ste14
MSSLAHTAVLPRRSRWIKSRGTIGLLILAPFLVLAVTSAPAWTDAAWLRWPVEFAAWPCFVAGVAFRFWAAAYIGGRKGQAISTDGPYSVCRNPLYFGTFLMLVAFTLLLQSLTFMAGALAASGVYLGMTIFDEERRLAHKFGPAYLVYCRETPRFFPRPWLLRTPERVEVNVPALARECRSAALYLWIPVAGRLLEQLRESRVLPAMFDLP